MIGETIGHYRIVAELGRGGMGVVYKAEDTKLRRTVALKFLSPHLLADPQQKARFIHEAQAAAVLDHPNISTIHEVHEADGHTFMVMAFIEGENVQTKIGSGPMSIDEALDIAVQVAKGLTKAHSEGIVHRDIKPGNVIITREGQAKVVDFGLAKLATQTQLTKSGMMVGTVRYMSPEQATGGEVDHRTDIWSLGVMLYEMLSGNLPFRGEVDQAIMYSVLNEDPKPVTEWRPEVPVALEDVVEKALAKDPQKRYATMDEFLVDLETQRDKIVLGVKERQFTGLRKLRRRKRLTAAVATVLVVAVAAILAQTFYTRSMAINSVAVLPFANLSGDAEQEYFSDGMTEQLINAVGRIRALRVVSRTSVNRFKKTDKTLPEIAAELNVDAVVEASVIREGDQVRITAQLIRANPEEVMWSESYNRDAQDVLSLLGEVARSIADRIEIAVTASERERLNRARPVDPDAHDAYLKGRYYQSSWNEEGFRRALQYFMDAIELDPIYAEPYVGLASCYSDLGLWGVLPTEEVEPKARAAALHALELDPSLGASYAALGTIKLMYDWDWYGPDADFRRAVELSPNDSEVHTRYDMYLTLLGRYDEAIEHSKKSIELDPLTSSRTMHLAWVYHYAGQYDKSIEISKKFVDIVPGMAQLQLGWEYAEKGMHAEAVAALDSAVAHSENPNDQVLMSSAGYYYARSGRKDKARNMLNRLLTLSETEHVDPGHIAYVYSGLGETEKMFEWLETGYETRSFYMILLPGDFGEYRDDPRYINLCQRIGIPLDD